MDRAFARVGAVAHARAMGGLDDSETAMAQLEQATKRLQTALDRLERAVEARAGNGADSDDGAEVRAALAAARKQNTVLQKAATNVAARLDETILRLKSTLEA